MKRAAEDSSSFPLPAKRSNQASYKDPSVPRKKYCFKFLLIDNITGKFIGASGCEREKIMQDTNTTLIFSRQGDFFPDSLYRVLGVYADDMSSLLSAFKAIWERLVSLASEMTSSGDSPLASELLGKEPGEYVLWACMTKRMSKNVIGTGGANIKELRSSTSCKVFIENESFLDHRAVKLIGTPENVEVCLERVNEFVQRECDMEDFYPGFAGIINFNAAAQAGYEPPDSTANFQNFGLGGGAANSASAASPASIEGAGVVVPRRNPVPAPAPRGQVTPPPAAEHRAGNSRETAPGKGEPNQGQMNDPVQDISELGHLLNSFPPDSCDLQFSITCEVDETYVDAVLGQNDDYKAFVEEATMTTIDIDSQTAPREGGRPICIVGSLLNCYTAHAMLMSKLRCTEDEEQAKAQEELTMESDDPVVLKQQIAKLQEKLASVTAARQG